MQAYTPLLLLALLAAASAADVSSFSPNLQLRGGSQVVAPAPTISATMPLQRSGSTLSEEASKLGKVAVTFEVTVHHIRTANSPPCKVVIVGSTPELGEWDVSKGVSLITTPGTFPIFTGIAFVDPNAKVEYKYAVVAQGGDTKVKSQWEAANRQLTTGKVGAVLQRDAFVEDRISDPRITDEPFQLSSQEWTRWYKHHTSAKSCKA
mmetsp:Transcript_36961/g.87549  ORF Transcript_36961/g.87549 Transcript_36961/m.87549 type:complete len:207 (-) Transcript_36961:266-886(-)